MFFGSNIVIFYRIHIVLKNYLLYLIFLNHDFLLPVFLDFSRYACRYCIYSEMIIFQCVFNVALGEVVQIRVRYKLVDDRF